MATTISAITAPVGIRDGTAIMPNTEADLAVMTGLLDRISVKDGGAAELPGSWETDRNLLIAEVTAFIVAFQTLHKRPRIDGVVDPGGGTLKLMNQLASEPPFAAIVVPAPGGRSEEIDAGLHVAATASVSGREPLRKAVVSSKYTRKLVRVDQSSIKWFGVVVPRAVNVGRVPHVFFTPTPYQGGYQDNTYDAFSAWGQLWDDYTSRMGGQMAAATATQVMIIPFYKNAQTQNLGQFQSNWQEVISAVATAAIGAIDPLLLRDTFTFDRIVSSSFSNGWIAHKQFNSGRGAAAMTAVAFDIDGAAAQPTSLGWRPSNGLKYINRPIPAGQANPMGRDYYVGDRWGEIAELYAPMDRNKTHFMCSAHLLFHGVGTFRS